MRRALVYFRLQLKRAGKRLPRVLAVSLALLVALAALALLLGSAGGRAEARKKLRLGVVGDMENPYLRMGVTVLEKLDELRYTLELAPMEEAEAAAALRGGRITAYVRIPEGFAEALYYGEVLPVTYVSTPGAVGIGAIQAGEVASALETILHETQSAIYSAQDYVAANAPDADPYAAGDALAEEYFALLLDRSALFETETVGVSDSLSFGGYYFCGVTVFFLLLWGVGALPLFSRRSDELLSILRVRGVGTAAQLAAEFVSCLCLMLSSLLCALALAFAALRLTHTCVPELDGVSLWRLLAGLLPAALTLCALQFLLYELSADAVSAVPAQFLLAAALGYAGGCFYPADFFPATLRAVGGALPAGAARRWLGETLLGAPRASTGLALFGWFALLLLLSALARRLRLDREGR